MNLKKMKGYMPQCASIARDKDSTWQQLTDSAILGELRRVKGHQIVQLLVLWLSLKLEGLSLRVGWFL